MDVHLKSYESIPYLNKDTIEEYSTLQFTSKDGVAVKMNALALAALNSSLIFSLSWQEDFDECCVVTEFSKSELEEVMQFCWTGTCQEHIASDVFKALGISLDSFFSPNTTSHDVKVKVEVKEEATGNEEFSDDDYFGDDDPDFLPSILPYEKSTKRGRKRKSENNHHNGVSKVTMTSW